MPMPLPVRHPRRVRRGDRGRRCRGDGGCDLKALGVYAARSLSYEGIECELVEHQLTAEQIRIYDAYAGAFSIRRRLTATPLRFANPSPPSGWIEDFHLQAVLHARLIKKGCGLRRTPASASFRRTSREVLSWFGPPRTTRARASRQAQYRRDASSQPRSILRRHARASIRRYVRNQGCSELVWITAPLSYSRFWA
jgi:P-loop containing NTP hydrolase pore-1